MTTTRGASAWSASVNVRPRDDGHAERLEVAGRHDLDRILDAFFRRRQRLAFDGEDARVGRPAAAARRCRSRRTSTPGQRAHALEQARVEAAHVRRPRVRGGRQADGHHRDVLGAEPALDLLHGPQRANQQPRAGEQHERQRDLRGDQHVAGSPARAARPFTAAFAQVFDDLLAARPAVPARVRRAARRSWRARSAKTSTRASIAIASGRGMLSPPSATKKPVAQYASSTPSRAADEREHERLGDDLPDQHGRARRRARCESPAPCGVPRCARASGWRDSRRRSAARIPTAASSTSSDRSMSPTSCWCRPHHVDAVAAIAGYACSSRVADRRHLGLRLLDRDARLQPADHRQPERVRAPRAAAGPARAASTAPRVAATRACRHHADDLVRRGRSGRWSGRARRRAAEAALPEAVRDHDHRILARGLVCRR